MKLQYEICTWANKTFGEGQRLTGILAHFKREVEELETALLFLSDEEVADELADCALFLFELAGLVEVDLIEEVEKKFKINQGRKWGPIQEDGSILHIKEEE